MKVRIFVCGIADDVSDSDGWTGRAVTWTNLNTPYHAEQFEYFAWLFSRSIRAKERARKLARKIGFYLAHDWKVDLIGHSNGANVIADALRVLNWPKIGDVHFLSPAAPEDCDKNGINEMRADGVTVYIGEKDMAMMAADSALGHILGFDDLGRQGPQNIKTDVPLRTVRLPGHGHSTWFDADHFEETMEMIKPT